MSLLERCELAETVTYLRSQGVTVGIDSHGTATFSGTHDDLSPRAVVALETVRGREAALRLVLDEADPATRARLEREAESLKRMRMGGMRAAAVRWAKPKARVLRRYAKPKNPGAPGPPRKTHCDRGHELNAESTYVTPDRHRRCRACCRPRDRERNRIRRERERERRTPPVPATAEAPTLEATP